MNDREIDAFLQRYQASCEQSRKRVARRRPVRYPDWNATATMVYEEMQTEPCAELTMPKDKLWELVERDRYFNQMVTKHDSAQRLLAERTIEDIIRRQNPAVEKAYQNYKTLLELCRT